MKKQLVEETNFKYSHSLDNSLPLIKINRIIFNTKGFEIKLSKSTIEQTKACESY